MVDFILQGDALQPATPPYPVCEIIYQPESPPEASAQCVEADQGCLLIALKPYIPNQPIEPAPQELSWPDPTGCSFEWAPFGIDSTKNVLNWESAEQKSCFVVQPDDNIKTYPVQE